jgi:hypothetical protein
MRLVRLRVPTGGFACNLSLEMAAANFATFYRIVYLATSPGGKVNACGFPAKTGGSGPESGFTKGREA